MRSAIEVPCETIVVAPAWRTYGTRVHAPDKTTGVSLPFATRRSLDFFLELDVLPSLRAVFARQCFALLGHLLPPLLDRLRDSLSGETWDGELDRVRRTVPPALGNLRLPRSHRFGSSRMERISSIRSTSLRTHTHRFSVLVRNPDAYAPGLILYPTTSLPD